MQKPWLRVFLALGPVLYRKSSYHLKSLVGVLLMHLGRQVFLPLLSMELCRCLCQWSVDVLVLLSLLSSSLLSEILTTHFVVVREHSATHFVMIGEHIRRFSGCHSHLKKALCRVITFPSLFVALICDPLNSVIV